MCVDHDCLRRFCVPPSPNDIPYFGEEAGSALNSCTPEEYNFLGSYWTQRGYQYQIRLATLPDAMATPAATLLALIAGHTSWDNTYNDCAIPPRANFRTTFVGDSGARPASGSPDGVNVIDFGDVASFGCPGALACTYTFADASNHVTETDQRFDASPLWSSALLPDPTVYNYDVWSVATHESGHSLGLAHANSSVWLTMYYQTFFHAIRARSLARGDALGLQARYP